MLGLALPASVGPVIGGTNTDPIRTDPTNDTPLAIDGPDLFDLRHAPVMAAGVANGAEPTPVDAVDVSYRWLDPYGRSVIAEHAPSDVGDGLNRGPVAIELVSTGNTTVIPAPPVAGDSLYVTCVTAVNLHATLAALLSLKGATLTRVHATLAPLSKHPFEITFKPAWQIAPNRALVANLLADAGNHVCLTVHFFTARSSIV